MAETDKNWKTQEKIINRPFPRLGVVTQGTRYTKLRIIKAGLVSTYLIQGHEIHWAIPLWQNLPSLRDKDYAPDMEAFSSAVIHENSGALGVTLFRSKQALSVIISL